MHNVHYIDKKQSYQIKDDNLFPVYNWIYFYLQMERMCLKNLFVNFFSWIPTYWL